MRSQIYYQCIAGANSPLALVKKGLEEYLVGYNIAPEKLVLGLPWYAYNYTCQKYSSALDICQLKHVSRKLDDGSRNPDYWVFVRLDLSAHHAVTQQEGKWTTEISRLVQLLIQRSIPAIGMACLIHLITHIQLWKIRTKRAKYGLRTLVV